MTTFAGNRVVQHTGTELPIFHAPIGILARAPLVGEVSAAGGVGLLETAMLTLPELQDHYDRIRARSNNPFGGHLMLAGFQRQPDRVEPLLEWALDGRFRFMTTGYGDPAPYLPRMKDAGITVYHMTDTVEDALRAEDAGADGIILGGAEKGGGHGLHTLHSFANLQVARRRLGVPIVASGGIADGIGMAAAFALGAEGVLMGTRFIASKECPWHPGYQNAVVAADAVIGIPLGIPDSILPAMRAVRTPYAESIENGAPVDRSTPYMGDARALFMEGKTDVALVGCGESAVLIDAVESAADIIRNTAEEFWSEIDRLSRLRQPVPA